MYAGFPSLTVGTYSEDATPIDLKETEQKLDAPVQPAVDRVILSYAALCHLVEVYRGAGPRRTVSGRLCGLQLDGHVEVTEVRPAIPVDRRRDYRETDEEWRKRTNMAMCEMRRIVEEEDRMFNSEEFDIYPVGIFVVCSMIHNPFNEYALKELMELYDNSQSNVMLVYDHDVTGVLGKPYLRAYVPTAEYIKYHTMTKNQMKGAKNFNERALVRSSNVTHAGVLREVPIEIDVDAYQKLGLQAVVLDRPVDTFSIAHSDSVSAYMKALVDSVRKTTETVKDSLQQESKISDKDGHGTVLAQRIKTLLDLQHMREQVQRLEALSNSVLINTALIRDL